MNLLNFFSDQKSIRHYVNVSAPALSKHGELTDTYMFFRTPYFSMSQVKRNLV